MFRSNITLGISSDAVYRLQRCTLSWIRTGLGCFGDVSRFDVRLKKNKKTIQFFNDGCGKLNSRTKVAVSLASNAAPDTSTFARRNLRSWKAESAQIAISFIREVCLKDGGADCSMPSQCQYLEPLCAQSVLDQHGIGDECAVQEGILRFENLKKNRVIEWIDSLTLSNETIHLMQYTCH